MMQTWRMLEKRRQILWKAVRILDWKADLESADALTDE